MAGLKPYRTISSLNTGPISDAYRDNWERTFGRKRKRRSRPAQGPESARDRVEELRAAAMRAHSGDNARDLEQRADALEADARALGVWDG